MDSLKLTKEQIMKMVSGAGNQRIRPFVLEKFLSKEMGVSIPAVKKALKDLIQEERLVFTYRDPCSYVEIPAVESHMQLVQ